MKVRANGREHEFAGPLSAESLVSMLGLPLERIALAVNGEIMMRRHLETFTIQDSDTVEVIAAVAGG